MTNIMTRTAAAFGLAGMLTIATAAPLLAQVVVDPYYAGPQIHVGPYGGYAYAPGYGGFRYWDGPAGYDTGGMAYSYRELGVQPGPWSGAPANPCTSGLRAQNRC
jgi:hypothetical protein